MKIFVTSIDTNVGKTVCSSILCSGLGYDYWKPVQCGDLDYSDSMKVAKYSPKTKIYKERYRLKAPMSPHEAASLEDVNIKLNDFNLPVKKNLIVEGAGGVMVPLNYDGDMIIDLAKRFNTRVIVVFKNYLGSINHTILTIEQIKSYGLCILGLVVVGDEVQSSEKIIQDATQTKILARIPNVDKIENNWVESQGKALKQNLMEYIPV